MVEFYPCYELVHVDKKQTLISIMLIQLEKVSLTQKEKKSEKVAKQGLNRSLLLFANKAFCFLRNSP